MADSWAKLWSDLPRKVKVLREVEDHGGDTPWLWVVCILLAKEARAHGRLEIEPGIPMRDREIQRHCPLSDAALARSLGVLLRWGQASPGKWLRRDPDGCYVVANLEGRQETPKAAMMRALRERRKGNASQEHGSNNPGNGAGNSYREAEAEADAATRSREDPPIAPASPPGPPTESPTEQAGSDPPPKGGFRLSPLNFEWEGLTPDLLDEFARMYPRLDVPAALEEIRLYWASVPRKNWHKDWRRTVLNRFRELAKTGSKASVAVLRTNADREWFKLCDFARQFNGRRPDEEKIAAFLGCIEPRVQAGLRALDSDLREVIELVRISDAERCGRLRREFTAAFVAWEEA